MNIENSVLNKFLRVLRKHFTITKIIGGKRKEYIGNRELCIINHNGKLAIVGIYWEQLD